MPNNPFLNTRLVNFPLGQPTSGSPLGVPIVGQGYDPALFFFFNNQPRNLGLGGVGGIFPTFSWNQAIIDRAANNPPLGFQTALVTFSASQAREFLNPDGSPRPGYDVRRFCSCGACAANLTTPGSDSRHTWTYVVYYNPGTVPDPPTSPSPTYPPTDRCRFCDDPPVIPPPTFPSLNFSISRFEATTAIYTYFDIAMEVRGNTYCAANITKDSKYKWTPEDGNGQDWNRAYFWILNNKFAGWADGVTPSPISFPSSIGVLPVPQPQRININNDGWLIEKMVGSK